MALSGNQKTRVGIIGPGRAYAGFTAKAAASEVLSQGLEFNLPSYKLHFTANTNRLHFNLPDADN